MTIRLHHLEQRFPGWRVEVLNCELGEDFYPDAKLVLIRTDYWREDRDHVEAHVAEHLRRHQSELEQTRQQQLWTAQQEAEADAGALAWLTAQGLP